MTPSHLLYDCKCKEDILVQYCATQIDLDLDKRRIGAPALSEHGARYVRLVDYDETDWGLQIGFEEIL